MSLPLPLRIFFLTLLVLLIYAPALNGIELWDDGYYIFSRYGLGFESTHWDFWRHHIWPLFDSLSAILFSWFGHHYWAWHTLNLTLHVGSAVLVATLAAKFRPRWYWPLLVLFLIHPLAVMSVAWIIQLKTVLCAFLLLTSIHLALKAWQSPRGSVYVLAVLLYTLALATKSAALPFAFIALLFFPRLTDKTRLIKFLFPFMVLSLASAWRIQRNSMVEANVKETYQKLAVIETPPMPEIPSEMAQVEPVTPVEVIPEPSPATEPAPTPAPDPAPAPAPAPAPEPEPEPAVELTDVAEPSRPELAVTEVTSVEDIPPAAPLRGSLIGATLGRYMSYPFWPWPLSLVHGTFKGTWAWQSFLGWALTLALLLYAFLAKQRWIAFCVLAQVMALVPFLGFITAPYFLYTYISEQHLYFALPFALAIQWSFIESRRLLPAILVIALSLITFNYTPAYRNEVAMFERVLEENPDDIFARFNLANWHRREGNPQVAEAMVVEILELAEQKPWLKHEPVYPLIVSTRELYRLE